MQLQFHLDGFRGSTDPLKLEFEGEQEPDFQSSLPEEVDVLIVGAGPAGQLLGAQLARFPGITTRIVEPKPGRLEQGQADGLQCRTLEIFEAFGFAEKVLKEAYWVNETTFWGPREGGGLTRTGRIRDTEEGLSEFPHVILNQARMHDFWLEAMKWSPTRLEPSYSRQMVDLNIPEDNGPVDVSIERLDEQHKGTIEHVRAKYVVGCDGARSRVRSALGLEMKGDFANQAWGVLDALTVTSFPDVRLKTAIHSVEGNIVIIPREGGYLTRFYIELGKLEQDERVKNKGITSDMIIAQAQRILAPFTFEVRHIAYWSVYEVGQRLTDHFDDVPKNERETRNPRVFITGDACHTHSAKAGQGMNVSMNDSYNLGWKLAAVLHGLADPKLLHTYSEERQVIAQILIDFDRRLSYFFALKAKKTEENGSEDRKALASSEPTIKATNDEEEAEEDPLDPIVFKAYFEKQGRFTAGVETHYQPGLITSTSQEHQHLATGFKIGTRFHSVQVLRLVDAKSVHLGHVMSADGRWRIVVFGDRSDPTSSTSAIGKTSEYLSTHLLPRYTPKRQDIDSVIDVRFVLQQSRLDLEFPSLPKLMCPHKGKFSIQDYEKVFTDEDSYGYGHGNIYKTRGVDRRGCVLIVRPDQYISAVMPLGEQDAFESMRTFFDGFMKICSS